MFGPEDKLDNFTYSSMFDRFSRALQVNQIDYVIETLPHEEQLSIWMMDKPQKLWNFNRRTGKFINVQYNKNIFEGAYAAIS